MNDNRWWKSPRSLLGVCLTGLLLTAIACGSDDQGRGRSAEADDGPTNGPTNDPTDVDSVTLQPVDATGAHVSDVDEAALEEAAGVLHDRLAGLGVDPVRVTVGSGVIEVELSAGERDLLDRVIEPGVLRFRPVLSTLPPAPSGEQREELEVQAAELRAELGLPEDVSAQDVLNEEIAAAQAQMEEDPENTTPPEGPQNSYGIDVQSEQFQELAGIEGQLDTQLTPREDIKADEPVTLADSEGLIYSLGPTFTSGDRSLEGEAVEDATAGLNEQGEWVVNPVFKGGEDGIDLFNAAASACFNGEESCPAQQGERGQLAIVLDGEVLTAPSINEATFARDQIQISGSFDRQSAEAAAAMLRHGALPLTLAPRD